MEARTGKIKVLWLSTPEQKPTNGVGWYPTLHCYDPMEGVFTSSAYWDGVKLKDAYSRPILYFLDTVFKNEQSAESFANDNDPGW